MMENQSLLNEINQFSLKAEHFEDVRPTMIQLLQSGVAQTLEDAYEKAIRLDPNLFEQMTKAQQAEVAAKQAKEQRAWAFSRGVRSDYYSTARSGPVDKGPSHSL